LRGPMAIIGDGLVLPAMEQAVSANEKSANNHEMTCGAE